MLRVVAKHANLWCSTARTAEEFGEKNAQLTQDCEAIGRDPSTLERVISFLVSPADTDFRQARETAQGFIKAKATHIVLNINAILQREMVISRVVH